jgi:tRNA dimethylallyltransferase
MNERQPLVIVVGPTASGKTELAVRLAEASNGEVVSADSVQVYRYFDVGAGKPSAEERARVPHHLLDSVDPLDAVDAARWAELAARAIADVTGRGRRPIVCGGTFLWVRALLFGLAPAPSGDPEVRQRHRALAEAQGREALHAELERVDARSAARLAPNDFVRVSRALEVFELSGVPMSEWQAAHGFREPRYDARLVGIHREREELDRRIAERVQHMLDAGWVEEVRSLIARGFCEARAMRSVGYRQIAEAVQSGPPVEHEALAERVYRATRVFARRQRTWLRDQPVRWLGEADARSIRLDDLLIE